MKRCVYFNFAIGILGGLALLITLIYADNFNTNRTHPFTQDATSEIGSILTLLLLSGFFSAAVTYFFRKRFSLTKGWKSWIINSLLCGTIVAYCVGSVALFLLTYKDASWSRLQGEDLLFIPIAGLVGILFGFLIPVISIFGYLLVRSTKLHGESVCSFESH